MGILDFFRRKKEQENKVIVKQEKEFPRILISEDKVTEILEEEIKHFFPDNGSWRSDCFDRPNKVCYSYLPCHLRDNTWMSKLLFNVLQDKGIYIPQPTIKSFMDKSENFANLRHEHELKIVKWQINWIIKGGENWIMPKGHDEISLLISEDIDKIHRSGVKLTLQRIGMDSEVIEEGLEKYADMWRPGSMRVGFLHLFRPIVFRYGYHTRTPKIFDEEHMKNWIADREYKYYQEHKNSVDKYGTLTPAMKMTPDEYAKLTHTLRVQNTERLSYIEDWKKSIEHKSKSKNLDNEDELTM